LGWLLPPFFVQKAQTVERQVKRKLIEPANADLPIGKRCKLLSNSRLSFYFQPKGMHRATCMARYAERQRLDSEALRLFRFRR
jgi:hypothetical protein